MQSKRSKMWIGGLEMKKLVVASVCGLCVWFGSVSVSHAAIISLDTVATVNDLFPPGDTVMPAGAVVEWDAYVNTLHVDVYTRAYTNGTTYAYLYQVHNKDTSSDPVEMFTLSPFHGADEDMEAGYLTDDEPAPGFAPSDKNPQSNGWVNPSPSGPIISFYYTWLNGVPVLPGEYSAVMYVLSDLAPDLIWASVIDGQTATDKVVGPVPEPATPAMLALGGMAILRRRRRGAMRRA